MCDENQELSGICNNCSNHYCSCCGDPLIQDGFRLSLAGVGGEGESLLDQVQVRLDVARKLAKAGWKVTETPAGIECKCPPQNEMDIKDQLSELGVNDDLIREGLDHEPVRSLSEIRHEAYELRKELDAREDSLIEDHLFGECERLERLYSNDYSETGFDPHDAAIAGRLAALMWVLGEDFDV